jgi:cell division protein ZapA
MVKDTSSPVFVHILDKDYQVACPPDERKALLQAAEDLDERMRTIRSSGSVVGLDRIAVMAALNLCHELHQARAQQESNPETGVVLERIADKLERVLERK